MAAFRPGFASSAGIAAMSGHANLRVQCVWLLVLLLRCKRGLSLLIFGDFLQVLQRPVFPLAPGFAGADPGKAGG